MWVCLDLCCSRPSVLLVSRYLFLSLGLGSFQQQFFQIHFQDPFFFTLFLGPLFCIDWHALYYPISLWYCFQFFFLFGFLSAVLIGWFPLLWLLDLEDYSRSLIHPSALLVILFIVFSSVFVSSNEFSNFSGLLLILSISFLQSSALLLITFLNPFSIFIISVLNSVTIRLRRPASLFLIF